VTHGTSGAPAPDKPDATALALERTFLAHERTLMAWTRTATSMISFGFTIYKFFQFELKGATPDESLVSPRAFGLAMIAFGLVSLLMGTVQQMASMRHLRAHWPEAPRSVAAVLASLIAVVGLGALLVTIARR
jgi:putative membrane protein